MKISQFANILNEKFPLFLQEDFDNSGIQLLYGDAEIKNILVSLDIDDKVIDEAIDAKCNLIVSHHPFFFKPIKKIDLSDPKSRMLEKLITNGISVYSLHTNLDKIFYNKLGNNFNIKELKILFPDIYGNSVYGFGSIGELENNISLGKFLPVVKKILKLDYLLYSGDEEMELNRVAFLNGAGGSMVEKICIQHSPDCIITGDVSYHNVKTAIAYNISLIDAGHFATEIIFVEFLKEEIMKLFIQNGKIQINVFCSKMEYNPFKVHI